MKKNVKSILCDVRSSKGFTLIELLVVIAIIGILSSVVLASLNTARQKGSDAAIKSNLNGTRAQAELFHDNGSTYEGVCAAGSTANPPGILDLVAAAAKNLVSTQPVTSDSQAFSYASGGGTDAAVCHDSANGWAAVVSLKSPVVTNSGWCVDSTGVAKEVLAATFTTPVSSVVDVTCN